MAIGDVNDIQNALIAIVKTIPDPNNPGEYANAGAVLQACPFTASDLPFFWVRRGRLLRRTSDASGLYTYVREYQLWLYVIAYDGVADPDAYAKLTKAANWTDPFYNKIDAVSRRLRTPAGGSYEIVNAYDVGDTDIAALKNTPIYAGQIFTVHVQTERGL